MTRHEQIRLNLRTIKFVSEFIAPFPQLPSYKTVTEYLNRNQRQTSRGNEWSSRALFRMLQRNGIAGLHGLKEQIRNGYIPTR